MEDEIEAQLFERWVEALDQLEAMMAKKTDDEMLSFEQPDAGKVVLCEG